ncbi:MAG: 50S ribosomal protein L32 [Candidatus Sericytochromatia bacterium]
MPQPKKKTSKSKRNSRRQHWRAVLPTLGPCEQCNEKKPSHMVCPSCGYYKGREVLQVAQA